MDTSAPLLRSVDIFKRLSTVFAEQVPNHIHKTFMHFEKAYELGTMFNVIMAQLIAIDPTFTSYKDPSMFGYEQPVPAPLIWYEDNSYEKRLLKVLYRYGVYEKLSIKRLDTLHKYIAYGVTQILAETPEQRWDPRTSKPDVMLAGGTRRRKRGSRRN